mmetsp:Transcript_16975/g.19291  ORF Transcript_16975/g.19291 Transcript_16975/m.19291 type:complete len:136 (+) Transcript_16975:187-594(+)|eukprot:CAMPEP_0184045518 /NCGR_PEP_ID=MMETSP0956-20121227/950_1 /TAXON_ID=627963 /ORGANISM="Aplanochytrium sp, Strain PBS07" /LENGTH=135 /DNA_ID=CAMNT_0026336809 /DNA_START=243 /DNA_END=650 /DNA_ORIENTATION=+
MENIRKMKAEVAYSLQQVEQQLYEFEQKYLESTGGYGNIVKGWDGYIDSKPKNNMQQAKRERRIKASERIFSITSATSPVPQAELEKDEGQRSLLVPTIKRSQSIVEVDSGEKKSGRGARKKKRKRKGLDDDYTG